MNYNIRKHISVLIKIIFAYFIFMECSFSEERLSKQELDKIMYEYIMENPQVILDSVDKSLNLGRGKQGAMAVSKSYMDENLLNLYVNNLINSDKGNPNKILDVGDSVLPRAPNDNYTQYNHEMRILIDSKKIKQDYLIKVLKSKLNILRNSLNNMQEVTDKYDLDKLTQ